MSSRLSSNNINGIQVPVSNGLESMYCPTENGFDIQGNTHGSNSRSGSCVGAPSPAVNSEIVSSMGTDNINSTSSVPPLHCIRINGGQNNQPMYRASFHVDRNLVGLVIGQNGSNVSKAYDIPDVVNVTIDEATVTIVAKTQEACQSARELLDIVEFELPIEESFYPRILGAKGENLHNLIVHSGVKKAYLMGSIGRTRRMREKRANMTGTQNKKGDDFDDGTQSISSDGAIPVDEQLSSAVIIVGTRSSVNKMKLLLEYQFESWNELGELEGARKTLQSELRKIDGRQYSGPNSTNSLRRRPPPNGNGANRGSAPPYTERTDSVNRNGDNPEKRQYDSTNPRRRTTNNQKKQGNAANEQQQAPPQNGMSGDQFPPLGSGAKPNVPNSNNVGAKPKGKNSKRKASGGNHGGSNPRSNGVQS